MIDLWTDGGCVPNPGKGAWAFLIVQDSEVKFKKSGFVRTTTNNRMEYQAALEALRTARNLGASQVRLLSDSRLLLDTLSEWAWSWKTKGWKKKGAPIKNLDLVQMLIAEIEYLGRQNVAFKWVRGHSGIEFNEMCDELCAQTICREIPLGDRLSLMGQPS